MRVKGLQMLSVLLCFVTLMFILNRPDFAARTRVWISVACFILSPHVFCSKA